MERRAGSRARKGSTVGAAAAAGVPSVQSSTGSALPAERVGSAVTATPPLSVEPLQPPPDADADRVQRAAEYAAELRRDLPGMGHDLSSIDTTRAVPAWDLLRTLNISADELSEQRVTTEELLAFLEMGEKRIVDLAVKVKLLESQNDELQQCYEESLAQRDQWQRNYDDISKQLSQVRHELGATMVRYDTTRSELDAARDAAETKYVQVQQELDSVRLEKRSITEERDQLRDQEKKTASDQKRQEKMYSDDRKNHHAEIGQLKDQLEKAKTGGKESDKRLQSLSRDLEKEKEDKKTIQQRSQNELRNMKDGVKQEWAMLSDEKAQLQRQQKDLEESEVKLTKDEEKLGREKEHIRKAMVDAVREIQDQREKEHQLLVMMKEEYEQDLQRQYAAKQQELEEHWRRKEQSELELMAERREQFENALREKAGKINEARHRLHHYSSGLERYNKRLRAEYERWQAEKASVKDAIDKATREREEVDDKMEQQRENFQQMTDDLRDQIEDKNRQIDNLDSQLKRVVKERSALIEVQEEQKREMADLEQKKKELLRENGRLEEDTKLLEKNFNDLKQEHDQLLEEMTYMRSREEEERELRRKTNEMLLASYRYKQPGSNELMPSAGGQQGFGEAEGAIDLLCWKCHQRQLEEEGSGLLARTRDARRQMRTLTVERRQLQGDRDTFLKAHKLDSEKLVREADDLRHQRKQLRKETEMLAAERKSRLAEQALSPRLKGSRLREAEDGTQEVWVSLAAADPDFNPTERKQRTSGPDPAAEAARQRKHDLLYLRSIYSSGSPRASRRHGAITSPPATMPAQSAPTSPSGMESTRTQPHQGY
eukprot:TRINITY_DN3386_c0_g1_i1.p1 TRINITY_DN3386_c0_g1~~TRINITY_DN3386_c0_g1_i1.p1  ORF type:complete len:848 (+),score=399.58 TRINITY_DN3386_c0_g1_i1:54-2546(+)